jgi:hypothetical protein
LRAVLGIFPTSAHASSEAFIGRDTSGGARDRGIIVKVKVERCCWMAFEPRQKRLRPWRGSVTIAESRTTTTTIITTKLPLKRARDLHSLTWCCGGRPLPLRLG